jgi:hypothetical protein
MMNLHRLTILLLVCVTFMCQQTVAKKDKKFCAQALTCGYHPKRGEQTYFNNACLPEGWIACADAPEVQPVSYTRTRVKDHICPRHLEWVCDDRGISHQNRCSAGNAKIIYGGHCDDIQPELTAMLNNQPCPSTYNPVCAYDPVSGSHFRLYDNACFALKNGKTVLRDYHTCELTVQNEKLTIEKAIQVQSFSMSY